MVLAMLPAWWIMTILAAAPQGGAHACEAEKGDR
jgi:hypothetical protein